MNRTGQYTLEYAALVVFVATALGVLFTYMKNCKQGYIRAGAEAIGDPVPNGINSDLSIEVHDIQHYYGDKEKDTVKREFQNLRELSTSSTLHKSSY